MSEMIERVAKAIFAAQYHPADLANGNVEKCWQRFSDERPGYFTRARAAIEALREPTDAMLRAADLWDTVEPAPIVWPAMIDAALKEPQREDLERVHTPIPSHTEPFVNSFGQPQETTIIWKLK